MNRREFSDDQTMTGSQFEAGLLLYGARLVFLRMEQYGNITNK